MRSDRKSETQPAIWQAPPAMVTDRGIREAMAISLRRANKSREQIADAMTATLDIKITVSMLNSWVANKGSARLPACFVPAFCAATGDDTLQRELLGGSLLRLVKLAEALGPEIADMTARLSTKNGVTSSGK